MTAMLFALLGFFLRAEAGGFGTPRGTPAVHTETAPRAGFGGVLVPKRVRLILGFVQTLPA